MAASQREARQIGDGKAGKPCSMLPSTVEGMSIAHPSTWTRQEPEPAEPALWHRPKVRGSGRKGRVPRTATTEVRCRTWCGTLSTPRTAECVTAGEHVSGSLLPRCAVLLLCSLRNTATSMMLLG